LGAAVTEVLLIEDDPSDVRLIASEIRRAYPTALIRDRPTLEQGIELVLSQTPQIIMCDLGLPDSSGPATIERLRRVVVNVPIVAMTTGDRHGAACVKAGADDFLDKQDLITPTAVQRTLNFTLLRWNRQADLERLAHYDDLTSLLTRAAAEHRYLRLLSNAREADYLVAVILADLNYFKSINDSYGHDAGDQVLRAYANAFDEQFRQLDVVSRWGGDEFVAILALADAEDLAPILARLQRVEVELTTPDRHQIRMTASYGSATVRARMSPRLDDLVRAADRYLLQAKRDRPGVDHGSHPRPGGSNSLGTPRILVVEDNEMDALHTGQALEECAFNVDVTFVDRAEAAREMLDAGQHFDLILLDLGLPGIPGHEFLQWLRAEGQYHRTPVAILTSSSLQDDADAAWAAGASAFLTKSQSLRSLKLDLDELLHFYCELVKLPGPSGPRAAVRGPALRA